LTTVFGHEGVLPKKSVKEDVEEDVEEAVEEEVAVEVRVVVERVIETRCLDKIIVINTKFESFSGHSLRRERLVLQDTLPCD